MLGETKLLYEDFNTILIEIEAIVNSRPLWAIPSHVDEYEALTPAHFLIFRALNTLPEPDVSHIPLGRLNQYQYLRRLLTDFWKLWSKEYLQQLQVRKKWLETKPNLKPNQIVLVTEDDAPPSCWSLGRIVEVFKGKDGLVRAVNVRFKGKIFRRSIHKLSLLPIADNEIKEAENKIEEDPKEPDV